MHHLSTILGEFHWFIRGKFLHLLKLTCVPYAYDFHAIVALFVWEDVFLSFLLYFRVRRAHNYRGRDLFNWFLKVGGGFHHFQLLSFGIFIHSSSFSFIVLPSLTLTFCLGGNTCTQDSWCPINYCMVETSSFTLLSHSQSYLQVWGTFSKAFKVPFSSSLGRPPHPLPSTVWYFELIRQFMS